MGKFFKWFFIILVALIALGVGTAYLLPQHVVVSRTVEVKGGADAVWPLVSDLKDGWPKWEPWTEMDPTIKVTYGAKTSGEGASQSWTGKEGSGRLDFKTVEVNKKVAYTLDFDNGKYVSDGWISLESKGDNVAVTWGMDMDAGMNPMSRWFGHFMDGMVGPEFEKGLNKIKAAAESPAK